MTQEAHMRVCANGHFLTIVERPPHFGIASFTYNDDSAFCTDCGASILDSCTSCGSLIPERRSGGRIFVPSFCNRCGEPYPWTPRRAMIGKVNEAIENSAELSAADKAILKEELAEIEESSADETRQTAFLRTIKQKAPQAWNMIWPIAQHLIEDAVKKQLGLMP